MKSDITTTSPLDNLDHAVATTRVAAPDQLSGKPRRALVTLLVGAAFQTRWQKLCRENWKKYANFCGCDLVVLTEPIDSSSRATNRSPSWQKCLIPGLKALSGYQQVAWVDADVFFNPLTRANLFEDVPEQKVGAVSSFEDPTVEDSAEIFRRMAAFLRAHGQQPASTPEEVYRAYGSGVEALSQIFNAGVMVFSPRYHAQVFQHVYDNYEESGNPNYYENVPLSYELVSRGLVHWMNPKFNHLWAWSKYLDYPFFLDWRPRTLRDRILRRLAKWSGNDYERRVASACATSALLNCHLLHFAGLGDEMDLCDMESAIAGQVCNLGVR